MLGLLPVIVLTCCPAPLHLTHPATDPTPLTPPLPAVAARGLDVKDLVLVVNYDVPNHHEDYVHRWGPSVGRLCDARAMRGAVHGQPMQV